MQLHERAEGEAPVVRDGPLAFRGVVDDDATDAPGPVRDDVEGHVDRRRHPARAFGRRRLARGGGMLRRGGRRTSLRGRPPNPIRPTADRTPFASTAAGPVHAYRHGNRPDVIVRGVHIELLQRVERVARSFHDLVGLDLLPHELVLLRIRGQDPAGTAQARGAELDQVGGELVHAPLGGGVGARATWGERRRVGDAGRKEEEDERPTSRAQDRRTQEG